MLKPGVSDKKKRERERERNLSFEDWGNLKGFYASVCSVLKKTKLTLWIGTVLAMEFVKFTVFCHRFKCGYSCDECEMVYASNSALSRHKKWHKGENPNHRFKCELCLYSTDSRKDFKRHGFIHSGERPFTCTLCGRGFTRNNHLKRHMLTHDAFPYLCNYCPKAFRRPEDLEIHIRKHQEENNKLSVFTIPSQL